MSRTVARRSPHLDAHSAKDLAPGADELTETDTPELAAQEVARRQQARAFMQFMRTTDLVPLDEVRVHAWP